MVRTGKLIAMSRGPVRTRVWRNGIVEADDFPFEQISDYLEQPDCIVWADLCAPDDEQLAALADELSLDRHAVEDAASEHARPKATRYATHIFISTYAMRTAVDGGVDLTHVSAFCLPRALITVRLDNHFDIETVVQRWDANADLLKYGKRALEYGLLDVIVDQYFDVLQNLDDQVEELQAMLFNDDMSDAQSLQKRTFRLRSALLRARRVLLPMRDLVETVMRRATEIDANSELLSYFQDLNDHVLRASEWSESLRELVASIFETNISLSDARLNVVVRRLTAYAAIVAVPTAITGYFGQNLRFPGYGTRAGFAVSLTLIVCLCFGLWALFKRKGWL
jgi:magnesium transporter